MNEITVYAIRTDTVRGLDLTALRTAMPERAEKARRFRFEKDRLLCLGAGFLMMSALGIRREDELRYGENGKPFAPGYPAFNLSHSGAWCALAAGNVKQIGFDLEEINEANTDIAAEVYTDAELAWMRGDPLNRFFQLWTWKESVMKAAGLGMNLVPRTFEVLPFVRGQSVQAAGGTWYASGGTWDNCRFSVCADEPVGRVVWAETTGQN